MASTMIPESFLVEPKGWCVADHLRPVSTFDSERRCDVCRGGDEAEVPLIPLEKPPESAYIEVEVTVVNRYHLTADDFDSPLEWTQAYWDAKDRKHDRDWDAVVSSARPVWEDDIDTSVNVGEYRFRDQKKASA